MPVLLAVVAVSLIIAGALSSLLVAHAITEASEKLAAAIRSHGGVLGDDAKAFTSEDMDRIWREAYGEPPDDGQMKRGQEHTQALEAEYELPPFSSGPTF